MRMKINTTGTHELRTLLKALGPEAIKSSKFVLRQVAEETVPKIKAVTPVQPKDGGELKASVRAGRPTFRKRNGEVSVSIIAGGLLVDEKGFGAVPAIYAHVQEAGGWLTGRLAGRRVTHTVGKSPFMAQEALKAAQTIPDRLINRILAVRRLLGLGVRP